MGSASRNASVENAIPVGKPLWTFNSFQETEFFSSKTLGEIFSKIITDFDTTQRERFFRSSAMYPLVVDDKVIVRTFSNIRALSIKDGKILWETAKINLPYLGTMQDQEKAGLNSTIPFHRVHQYRPKLGFLGYQSWSDHTFGRLSSDRNHVYAIEKFPVMEDSSSNIRFRQHSPGYGKNANILRSYHIENGRLIWEVGGNQIGNWEPDQPDLFFMGPPLPLNDLLYCMVKSRGEIQLIVLNPKNGERIWTQQLGFSTGYRNYDNAVKYAPGISPVYGNGVLVCETNAGTVIGIDPIQRSLLWGTRYRKEPVSRSYGIPVVQRNLNSMEESDWIDTTPVISHDTVLLTPKGSNQLICLNLLDGSVRWKKIRPQGLFIATAHEEKVVLVEKNHVTAYWLKDGSPAWKQPIPITSISGRGCRMNDLYLLSLSSGEILSIDLAKGEIRARSYEDPSGFYGNLVAAKGQLISQFLSQVSSFHSIPEIKKTVKNRLAINPEDPDALAMRGEIRLYQDRKEEGLNDLKKSWKLKNDSHVQKIIARIMLDEISDKYEYYLNHKTEWEQYLQSDDERIEFLERLAILSFENESYDNAIRYWMEVIQLAKNVPGKNKKINPHYSMNRDVWIGFNLRKAFRMADSKIKEQYDKQVLKLAEEFANENDKKQLYRFLNIFGYQKFTEPAQSQVVLIAENEVVDTQLQYYLEKLVNSSDSTISAKATFQLLKESLEKNETEKFDQYLNLLTTRFADVTITDHQNGLQIGGQFKNNPAIPLLKTTGDLLENHLQVTEQGKVGNPRQGYLISSIGEESVKFANWKFQLNSGTDTILAYNNLGEYQWSFPIKDLERIGKPRPRPRTFGNFVISRGDYLVFVVGSYAFALDASAKQSQPVPLWEIDLVYFSEKQKGTEGILIDQLAFSSQGQIYSISQSRRGRILKGKIIAAFGVMTDHSLTYFNKDFLKCINLQTGETIWQHKVGYGNMTLLKNQDGKQKEIVLLQKNGTGYFLHRYQSAIGSHISSVKLKKDNLRVIRIHNNHLLSVNTSRENDKQISIELYDPVNDKTIWNREYDNEKVSLGVDRLSIYPMGYDELSVIQKDGKIQVISLADGKLNLDVQVEKRKDPRTLFMVVRNKSQYLILPRNLAGRVRTKMQSRDLISLTGTIYAFDRTTQKKMWEYTVRNQYTPYHPPADFPLLVIFNRVEKFNRAKRMNHTGKMLFLDKRTGQPIYESQITGMFNYYYHMAKERNQNQYSVYLFNHLFELKQSEIPLDKKKPDVIVALPVDDVPLSLLQKNNSGKTPPKSDETPEKTGK